jgi:hypothetical protein
MLHHECQFLTTDPSYAPVVDGLWFEDFPTNLMADGKFIAVPTIIGHTTDELFDRIAVKYNFTTTQGIIIATGYNVPFCPPEVLEDMLALFEPSNYLDIALASLPVDAGPQWSRVVDVDNYLQSFCAVYHAAGQIAAKGKDVWKCKPIRSRLQLAANHNNSSLECPPFNMD